MKNIIQSVCPLCSSEANYQFCDHDSVKYFVCPTCWQFFISKSAENKLEEHRKEHFSKIAVGQKGSDNVLCLTLKVPGGINPAIIPRTTYRL